MDVTLLFVPGAKAVFRCNHQSPEDTIGWTINGSVYSVERFPNITRAPINENGVQVGTLTIPAKPEYNRTEVVCHAFFSFGSRQDTPPAMLLIMEGECCDKMNSLQYFFYYHRAT